MQPGDVPITYADTTALEEDFGFKPSTSSEKVFGSSLSGIKNFYKIKIASKCKKSGFQSTLLPEGCFGTFSFFLISAVY